MNFRQTVIIKDVEFSLNVEEKTFPQAEEFRYLKVLELSDGRMNQEMNRSFRTLSAVLSDCWIEKELSQKAKVLIYWSV